MYQLCHFTLYGDFDVADVTEALALEPSMTLEKGELLEVGEEFVPCLIATWDLDGPDGLDINGQVEFLVATLWEREEKLREFTDVFKAELMVVITGKSEARSLSLKPDALRKLAAMKITLNCDYIDEEAEDAD